MEIARGGIPVWLCSVLLNENLFLRLRQRNFASIFFFANSSNLYAAHLVAYGCNLQGSWWNTTVIYQLSKLFRLQSYVYAADLLAYDYDFPRNWHHWYCRLTELFCIRSNEYAVRLVTRMKFACTSCM